MKTKTNNEHPNNNKRPQGRPAKGMPEPFNMTAEGVARAMFNLEPEKEKEKA